MKSFRLYNVTKAGANDWRAVRALGVLLLVIAVLTTIPTLSILFESIDTVHAIRSFTFGAVLSCVFWLLAVLVLHAAWRLARDES